MNNPEVKVSGMTAPPKEPEPSVPKYPSNDVEITFGERLENAEQEALMSGATLVCLLGHYTLRAQQITQWMLEQADHADV